MTQADLFEVWKRWMHRADLDADLSVVFSLTGMRISEKLLFDVDLNDVLANAPRMYVHGGLAYLNELTRDIEGWQLENDRFNAAAEDYAFAASRKARPSIHPGVM